MTPWLLREIEKDPSRVFMEKELATRSQKDYARIKKAGLLKFVRLEVGTDYIPCSVRCSLPCAGMRLNSPPKGLAGFVALACCDEDPDVDPILMTKKDLAAYRLDLDTLAEKFRAANSLGRNPSRLDYHLLYLGEAQSGGLTLAVVICFFPDARNALKSLLSLPSLVSGHPDRYLVVLPSHKITDQADLVRLERLDIFMVKLDEKDPFKIDLSPALKKPTEKPVEITLTPEEEKEFDRHQFKSRLPIEITGDIEKRATNILRVAGAKVTLGDAPFALFLRLVVELFKGGDGCVYKGDPVYGGGLIEEGYLNAAGVDQAIRRLREAFIPALHGLPPPQFIEVYKHKQIRLSTHPTYVSINLDRLLQHGVPAIRLLAVSICDS